VPLPARVLDQVEALTPLAPRGRLLGVGYGVGGYVGALSRRRPGWTTIAVDVRPGRSFAMADAAARDAAHDPARSQAVVEGVSAGGAGATQAALAGDAAALPIARDACDLVLAPHLLGRVPTPTGVVSELARVCRPSGLVVVVVDGPSHQAVLRDLVNRAAGSSVWPAEVASDGVASMLFDGGVEVVAADTLADEIAIDRPAPVLGYLQGLRSLVEPRLRGFTNWTMVLARARAALDEALRRDGEWTSPVETAVFVCRPPR
jgi:SAM-dependent methyltransferase